MRVLAGALLGLASCGGPDTTKPEDRMAVALAQSETQFAVQSVKEDMRSAFLAHFAPDGVFVRDNWTNAHAYLAHRPAPPIVLDWRPVFVVVSSSGDLGLSTGPWTITNRVKPDDPPSHGQFVSIWRREAEKAWKVIVDTGIGNPGAMLWTEPLQAIDLPAFSKPAQGGMSRAESRFTALASREGMRAGYLAFGSNRLRVLREGNAPAIGKDAAMASSAAKDPAPAWRVERADASRAGDFGYVRGCQPGGCFLHVWIVEDGEWRLLLDVVTPVRS